MARRATRGPTATANAARPKITGFAATASPTSPRARATAAVVRPQAGQGTPVSVRSGQGKPSPVPLVTDGHTAAPTATSTPNPPRRSGTENARTHDPP